MNGYIKRSGWFAATWLGCLMLASTAQAASFDCAKAQTKVEHLICDNSEISKLDAELNSAYKTALQEEKQADSIKHAQKEWMKERNGCSDADCVKRAYEDRLRVLSSPTVARNALKEKEEAGTAASLDADKTNLLATPDRPGFFRLDQSTNNEVCFSLGRIINSDIKKYGKTQFEDHSEFVEWSVVDEENIVRGEQDRYSESVERADVDINNDGVVDQVIRTKWTLRYVLQDELDVLSLNQQKVVINDLLNSEKKVKFNAGNYWLDRYKKKYDLSNEDWWFDGVASLNIYKQNGEVYLVAQNYAAPRNVAAKIYVFQVDKVYRKHEERDACMFVRICPCGGCVRMSANQAAKTLPAKKWCHK